MRSLTLPAVRRSVLSPAAHRTSISSMPRPRGPAGPRGPGRRGAWAEEAGGAGRASQRGGPNLHARMRRSACGGGTGSPGRRRCPRPRACAQAGAGGGGKKNRAKKPCFFFETVLWTTPGPRRYGRLSSPPR